MNLKVNTKTFAKALLLRGTTIGKIIANNVLKFPSEFQKDVSMYTYDEEVNGSKLSEIINQKHENVKYLPGIKLPENLIAVPDLKKSVENSDFLVLVLPFQFLRPALESIKGSLKKNSYALTLAKGIYFDEETKGLLLVSQLTEKMLNIPCYSMMGANIATEIANDHLCESTIGCDSKAHSEDLKKILSNDNFLLQNSKAVVPVEMFGALKVNLKYIDFITF